MIRWDALELEGGLLGAFASTAPSALFLGAPVGFHKILAGRSKCETLRIRGSVPSIAAKNGEIVSASFEGRPLRWSIEDVVRDSSKWFKTNPRDPHEVIERFALGPVATQRWDRVPVHIAKLVAIAAAYATGARTLIIDDLSMNSNTREERALFDWMEQTLRSGLRDVSWISLAENDATPLYSIAEERVSLYGGHPVVLAPALSPTGELKGAIERVVHVVVEGGPACRAETSFWSEALHARGIEAHWSSERNAWIELGVHSVRALYETLPAGLMIREVIPLVQRGVKEDRR